MSGAAECPDPGNVGAWCAWVANERRDRLIRWIMRTTRVNDPVDAADILQDTTVMILGPELDLPDQRADAWSWLLSTASYVARNWCRYEDRRETEPVDQVPASEGRGWEVWAWGWKLCERLELEEALKDALACLTPDQREVIELQYYEQWTARELAEHRGCSPDAVRKLTSKALAKLAEDLEGRFLAR